MAFKRDLWCLCVDLAVGTVIAALFTFILGITFLGLSGKFLAEVNPPANFMIEKHASTIEGVYAMVIIFSVGLLASSITLCVGVGKRSKWLFIPWFATVPLWTVFMIADLAGVPETVVDVHQSNPVFRIFACLMIILLNIYAFVCVVFYFLDVWKNPTKEEDGPITGMRSSFRTANSRLRNSFRRTNSWTRGQVKRISMRKPKGWAQSLEHSENTATGHGQQRGRQNGPQRYPLQAPTQQEQQPYRGENRLPSANGAISGHPQQNQQQQEQWKQPKFPSRTNQPEVVMNPASLSAQFNGGNTSPRNTESSRGYPTDQSKNRSQGPHPTHENARGPYDGRYPELTPTNHQSHYSNNQPGHQRQPGPDQAPPGGSSSTGSRSYYNRQPASNVRPTLPTLPEHTSLNVGAGHNRAHEPDLDRPPSYNQAVLESAPVASSPTELHPSRGDQVLGNAPGYGQYSRDNRGQIGGTSSASHSANDYSRPPWKRETSPHSVAVDVDRVGVRPSYSPTYANAPTINLEGADNPGYSESFI